MEMKFIFRYLFLLLFTLICQPVSGYTFCNKSEKSINVLIFANANDAAEFLNQYHFSSTENGPAIPIILKDEEAPKADLKEGELSELPTAGWIRIHYSSAGSAAYLTNNNAIKQYNELKSNTCKSEDPSQLLKSYSSKTNENQLYYLIFENNAIIDILPDGRKEYLVKLLEQQSSLIDEDTSFGSFY